jgi:hypothetical protein
MTDGPLTDWSRRYGLDDLEQFLDPAPAAPEPTVKRNVPYIGPERPGEAFNARHSGGEILVRLGFTMARKDRSGDEHYTRPGKERRQGTSATVYADGHTTIWSDTCLAMWPALDTRRPYDPFGLYAATSYNGDFTAASRELGQQGYGEPWQPRDLTWFNPGPLPIPPTAGATAPDADTWPDPEPLEPELTHGPPFPVEVLPAWMAEAAVSCAESLQAPVDLPAILALGALSTVTMGHIEVHLPESDGWVEPTNLYLVVALPPGEAKSPAFKMMLACVRQLETELLAERAPLIREAEVTREILAKKAKAAREAAALPGKTAEDAKEAARLQYDAESVTVPNLPRLVADDATPEALVMLMATTGERIALQSSEGGLFDMMAGQYANPGKTSSLDIYLKGWSGDAINQDRAGRDAVSLAHPLVSVCVTPQPILVKRIGENPELAGRGVSARFLYSVPFSNVGGRDRTAVRRRTNPGARQRYEEQVLAIGRRLASWVMPVRLNLAEAAADAFIDWDQEHEYRLAPGADLADMAEWFSKLRAAVLRMSGILHIAEGLDHREPVSVETLERAFVLADYWIEHARCVHASWGDPLNAVAGPARTLVKWAVEERLRSFTQREAYLKLRSQDHGVKISKAVEVLEQLIELGWLRAEGDFPGQRGKTATLLVHPAAARALSAHGAQPASGTDRPSAHGAQPSVEDEGVARHEACAQRRVSNTHTSLGSTTTSPPEHSSLARMPHGAQLPGEPPADPSGAHGAQPEGLRTSPPPPVVNAETDPDDDGNLW